MIIWIASYPRSGNTFFRAILDGLYGLKSVVMQQVPEPAGPWLEVAAAAPERRYLKTHHLPRGDGHPAIYLLRDGRDALVSYAWFTLQVQRKKDRADITPDEFHATLKDLIENADAPFGDWSANVSAWTGRPNTFVVRYEDLVRQPRELAMQAIAFIGANLQLLPDADIPTFGAMNQRNPTEARRGVVGSWKDEFPQDLLPLFWQRHGETMRALGYHDPEFNSTVPSAPLTSPRASTAAASVSSVQQQDHNRRSHFRTALGAVRHGVRQLWQSYLERRAPALIHVTHWQAGAQWLYRVLHHCCPHRTVAPEGAYDHLRHSPIERGRIYPNVYATREQLDQLTFPEATRRLIVIRDLRDTLASLFAKRLPVGKLRLNPMQQALSSLSDEDRLLYLIDNQLPRCAAIQESWLDAPDPVLRYEDLLQDETGSLERVLLQHCRLPASKRHVYDVVQIHRSSCSGDRDIGIWRDHFTPRVAEVFKARFGKLLIATGYEKDMNWEPAAAQQRHAA